MLVRPVKIEWISFFALMPVLCIAVNILLFSDAFLTREVLIKSYPVVFVYGFVSWYFHIYVMRRLREKMPSFSQTYRRLLLILLCHTGLTAVTLYLIFWSYDSFHFMGYVMDYDKAKWCVVIAILLTLTASTSWEGSYIYQQWKDSMHENELLQKLNLESEFDSLKNQVNPHFLFNSLNSLSSLIHENPRDAEIFLDKLSKVYRYILNNNRQNMIDLSTELRFLESYHHLLKTRYNNGLNLEIDIDESKNYFLPPLTLQLLLENAVKHNVILKEKPLNVKVCHDGPHRIMVINNLQKKTGKLQYTKIGLADIAAKFKLMNLPEIIISETAGEFTVSIPLTDKL
jgi:two-component system LytT family sensor kinase